MIHQSKMKIISFALITSLLVSVLSGCTSEQNKTDTSDSDDTNIEASTELTDKFEEFEAYELEIINTNLDIFSGPGYSFDVVGKITEEGTYTICEEQTDDYGTVWGRLENKKGWIDLELTNERLFEETVSSLDEGATELEDLVLAGNQRYYLESELSDKSEYELTILRNGIYALSGRKFVKNQEVKEFFENCDWYIPDTEDDSLVQSRFNEYQKANLALIIQIESGISSDEQQTDLALGYGDIYQDTESTGGTNYTEPLEPESNYDENEIIADDTEFIPETVSQKIEGVTFNYVNPFKYTAEYTGGIIDYNINLSIKYCEPSEYMSENDRIIGIYSSDSMYKPEDIGSLYKSAGYDDFAVFEISFSGNYINEFTGAPNIEFRHYTSEGILLKNIVNGITDYEMISIDGISGTIDGKCYMGFYRSEVGRVDFRILGVGPQEGLGGW